MKVKLTGGSEREAEGLARVETPLVALKRVLFCLQHHMHRPGWCLCRCTTGLCGREG